MTDVLTCSAKGCANVAQHQVLWNNPKIHTPDRRKIWLACDEHEASLRAFLGARGFWKETQPIDA
ncbi:acetone carboxylase [Aeromicrobium sp.]|uniref:acetone carboxylase n=1 Tax=Aeromicrobium sp. TaxID=1871063 RepID=UPI0019AD3EEB|nr:acetone carboxylase [Aeromicrobium sp.]MBC7629855.1 acetone carboxylase [Aeromicrobium sp.]